MKDLRARLLSAQLSARAAMADTPGCAWAVAHYGRDDLVPPGRASEVLGSLPIAALRLPDQEIAGLRDVGTIALRSCDAAARLAAPAVFGRRVVALDQALGAAVEVLAPVIPREVPRMALNSRSPSATRRSLRVMTLLCENSCLISPRGRRARRLDMVFQRVDNIAQAIRIGTSKPNRDAKHLTKLPRSALC